METEKILKQLFQQNYQLIKNVVTFTSLICLLCGFFTNHFIDVIIGGMTIYKTINMIKSEDAIDKHKSLLKLWVIVCFIFSFEYMIILQIPLWWLHVLFNIVKIICCNGIEYLTLMYDLYAEKIVDNMTMCWIYMNTTDEVPNDTFNVMGFVKSKLNYVFGNRF